jgi:hypothetical protein
VLAVVVRLMVQQVKKALVELVAVVEVVITERL